MMFRCPLATAMCKAVAPKWLYTSILAPFSINILDVW